MADNFAFTEGAGKTGAADDISGVLFAKIKLDFGTDGVSAPALAGTGIMATGVQRVTLATDDPAVVDLAAIEVLLGTIDADTGAVKTAVELIDNAISGSEMQVDVVAALPAGTNAIGKLAANTGVDIGDVDITSIIPLTGATNLGKARDVACGANDVGVMALAVRDDTLTTLTPIDGDYVPLRVGSTGALHTVVSNITACNTGAVVVSSGTITANLGATDNAVLDQIELNTDPLLVVGGGAEATAIRVTIANDSTGLVSIDDGGGALTVDGTVTANLSAIDNAVLDTIDAVLDTINAKLVTGTIIGDVNLGATDNAVLDAIAASLVTIDSDTNDIKIATEIVDDWDATHASAASADGPQVMGAGYSTGLPTDVGADGDAARICTDRYGRVLRGVMPQNFQATFTSADAQAATPVKTKTADRKMYILSLVVSVDTAMNVQFQDDTGPTVLIEGMYFAANGGAHLTWPAEAPLVVNTNEDFDIITSAAGNISVTITGYLAV